MTQLQRGLVWVGGGVLGVVLSQLLLAIGSLLGIFVFPVGALSALYGIYLLITLKSKRRWSDPVEWSLAAGMLAGAGIMAWIYRDWTIFPTSAVIVSLVVVARQRRARLAREWQEHLASRHPDQNEDGYHGS